MRYFVTFQDGSEHLVEVEKSGVGALTVSVGGRTYAADILPAGSGTGERLPAGAFNVRLDDRVVDLWVEGSPPELGVVAHGCRFYARAESERMRAIRESLGVQGTGEGLTTSPMPGRIVRVLVAEGDEVQSGAALIVVEAMKMENELCAQRDGRVAKIYVAAGATVEGGAKLVELE
jgi:biotin carboxyl carrier protein